MKRILFFFFILCFHHPLFASSRFEEVGDVGQVALPVSAIAVTFLKSDLVGFKEFAYSYLLSTGSTQLLKHTIKRERPNHHSQSFPSGHTANGFVSASFFQFRYGWKYGVPGYMLASMIGYSRIQAKKHWPTDVLTGACIGIGSSYLFTHKYLKNLDIIPYYHPENDESGIRISAEIL